MVSIKIESKKRKRKREREMQDISKKKKSFYPEGKEEGKKVAARGGDKGSRLFFCLFRF